MGLNDDQKKFYQESLKKMKADYVSLDADIQKEVERVKKLVAQLKEEQKTVLQMYAATCSRLGTKNDLADDLAELVEETKK